MVTFLVPASHTECMIITKQKGLAACVYKWLDGIREGLVVQS